MYAVTCKDLNDPRRHHRGGVAVLLVLAVIAITLALAFALSRSSLTMAQISAHESCGLEARAAVEMSVGPTMNSLGSDPNWMPSRSPVRGALNSGETYQVDVQITQDGAARGIDASAQVSDLAEKHLTIDLAKQTRSDLPTAAIAAFATKATKSNGPPVYIARGNTVRGNVRSRGPIHFQAGFVLEGTPYAMGNVSRSGTGANRYENYRASWGTSYQAALLAEHGQVDSTGRLFVDNVVLGPSTENPMGVFYHNGTEVVLGDNVHVAGTLAIRGSLKIVGTGVYLIAVQEADPPPGELPVDGLPPGTAGDKGKGNGKDKDKDKGKGIGKGIAARPADRSTVQTSFPAAVVDGSIVIDETADVVRVSGVLVASQKVQRLQGATPVLACKHDHSVSIDKIKNWLKSDDGPAIYMRGAIVAKRVSLQHRAERPLALVFDATVTDVSDAPGFFTWRVTEWTEAD